jgi:uncharacterized DUF497 family protein
VFDWTGGNAEKIRRLHDVEPHEAEEALADPDLVPEAAYNVEYPTHTEKRRGALGMTEDGRLLFVAYTKRAGLFRVITAYDASPAQARRYRRRTR